MRRHIRKIKDSFFNFQHVVLISSVLFCLIIGTAFFLVYENAEVMREQINTDFNQQQLVLARQAAHQIDINLHDIEVNLESLTRLLAKIPREDWKATLYAVLERRRSRGLMEIGIADRHGEIVALQQSGDPVPPIPDDFLSDCRASHGGTMTLGPLRILEAKAGITEFTSLLCFKMQATALPGGTLFARLNLSQLVGNVTQHIRSGKTGYVWTVSESGEFIYHPEEEFVGKNAFTARKERKPKISFKQINMIMKERMLNGEEGTGTYVSGWHRGVEGDMTKLIAFSPVKSTVLTPEHTWSVAVVAPISEVAEIVRNVYVRHFKAEGALIVGMFVFGLLVAVYQHRMSEALKRRVEETEADLHEKERIYKRIVEQATDLIYIFDLDMRIVIFNKQTVNMFSDLLYTTDEGGKIPADADVSREEFWKGNRLDDMMRPEDTGFMRMKLDEVLKKKKNISYEHTITHRGRQTRLSTKLIPIRDDYGEVHFVLGISRDMTEKMEMDQRIYNAEKLASIGILASGVAHEINNPLAIILGFTDLLLERFDEGSSEKEDLKLIEQNANLAKKVVENLLGFARITEGLEDTVDVKNSIETALQIVKNTLMTKKIDCSADLPDTLPRVRGDSREFQQVIFNLITNAVGAMADKEGDGRKLTLTARADSQWVHVNVTDSGIGIPKRIKPQIFDPFFTTKKVGEGTGLGLSLCYGIVAKYGGKINFSSISAEDYPDRPTGTTFVVSMPQFKEAEPEKKETLHDPEHPVRG